MDEIEKEVNEQLKRLKLSIRPIKSDEELKEVLDGCHPVDLAFWDIYSKEYNYLSLKDKVLNFFWNLEKVIDEIKEI